MEDYSSPRRTLHVLLVRSFMLQFSVAFILIYFWLSREYSKCWETSLGQQIYVFIIANAFVNQIVIPIICILRVIVINKLWPNCERPEFDITQNCANLLLNQTFLWLGLLFAPLLAAVMIVEMFGIFYLHKTMLMHLCKAPQHVWLSVQTQALYLIFSFVALLGVIVTYSYIMTQIPISTNCGPFRTYIFMLQILIDDILKLRHNHTVWLVLGMLMKPGAVAALLVLLTTMVYYLSAKARGNREAVKMLKHMIYMEVKDQQFLLAQIATFNKKRAQFCTNIESET